MAPPVRAAWAASGGKALEPMCLNRSKLIFNAAIAIMCLCGSAWPAGGERISSQDWPGWRGPTHDGQCAEIPPAMPELKLLWKQRVAGRCDAGLAAADGVVVAPDSDGRRNDYYWCFDAATGKELWNARIANGRQMAYSSAPRATPCIYKGKVVTIGAFGDVHCYDLKTGKSVWEKNYRKDFGAPAKPPEWGYAVAPLIFDDKLILMPGDLVALDPNTGRTIWRARTAGPNYSSFTPAAVGAVREVVGYDANSVGGWDIASGKRIWSMPVDNSKTYIVPSPVVLGPKLLLATESDKTRLYNFAAGGAIDTMPLGENGNLRPEMATPTVVGGLVLGISNGLVCLDPNDGIKTLWIQKTEDAFQDMAHIVATGDRAMVFGDRGDMVMIRATREKCEILGRAKLCGGQAKDAVVWSHPAIAGGVIFIRDDKYLYAWQMLPTKFDK